MELKKADDTESKEPPKKKRRTLVRASISKGKHWRHNYNQRFPLVRYLDSTENSKGRQVKFFHRNLETDDVTSEDFKFLSLIELDRTMTDFVKHFTRIIEENGSGAKKFTLKDIASIPYWADVIDYASILNASFPDKSTQDVSELQVRELDRETKDRFDAGVIELVDEFMYTLSSDFSNGEAKYFLTQLIQEMFKTIPKKNLECIQPVTYSKTTTYFENSLDPMNFCRSFTPGNCTPSPSSTPPESPSISLTPSTSHGFITSSTSPVSLRNTPFKPIMRNDNQAHKKVSDFEVISSDTDGCFPLLIEVKSSESLGCSLEPESQNVEQMFTKFFVADVIFGLCITSRGFIVQAMIKNTPNDGAGDKVREIRHIRSVFNTLFLDSVLNVDIVRELFSFIYSVLEWSCQTGCMIH